MKTTISIHDVDIRDNVLETYTNLKAFAARLETLSAPGSCLIIGFDVILVENDDADAQAIWDEYVAKDEAEAAECAALYYPWREEDNCSPDVLYGRSRRDEESDYGPSTPWNAPGMCVSDFIRGVSMF